MASSVAVLVVAGYELTSRDDIHGLDGDIQRLREHIQRSVSDILNLESTAFFFSQRPTLQAVAHSLESLEELVMHLLIVPNSLLVEICIHHTGPYD